MKKVFIFLMLTALFAPLALNAQRGIVQQKDVDLSTMPMISLSELDSKGGDRATNTLMTENFDGMSSISTTYSATGWYAYNAGSGNNWGLAANYNYANSGSNSAYYQFSSRYAADCYLVSAPFNVSADMSLLGVSLYERVRQYYTSDNETFEVFFVKANDVTTAAAVASATHYDAIPSASYSNTTYAQKSGFCMSSALAGQSVRVVVHCTSARNMYYLYIDDIIVTENTNDTDCDVVTLPHFNGFESVAEYGCWTMSGSDMTLSTSDVYGGNTCLRLNGLDNHRWQYLISPEFDGNSAMEMSFYYKIANANRDQFFYLAWGPDLDNLSYGDIEIADNTTYLEYTEVFPKGTKYVVLAVFGRSSVSSAASYMLVDNIYFHGGCIKPRGLEANNITPNTADISWGDYSDNGYNVRYRTVTRTPNGTPESRFSDDFETGSLSTTKWSTQNQNYTSTSTDWGIRSIEGVSGYNGSNYYASSRSYDGETDHSVKNWLITSSMTLGNAVEFYMKENHPSFLDHVEVLVSKDDLTFVSVGAPTVSSAEWEQVSIDLDKYLGQTGYVAILHEDSINDFVAIDNFSVLKYNYNYSYGQWQTVEPSPRNNSAKLEYLTSETMYEVQVQSACGSDWSTSIYFTTLSGCTAPIDLIADDITPYSATLSWSEYQDIFDVRYRGQVYFEDFNRGIPSDWTTINADGDNYDWQVMPYGYDGSPCAGSASYINNIGVLTPDNWLISPQLDLGGFFEVWLKGLDPNTYYREKYTIYLSTTGKTVQDFTTQLATGITTNEFQRVTADLSNYEGQQGYIAIRHHDCTDQYWLLVDNFGIYKTDWITATPSDPTVSVAGLLMNTEYVWQVSGQSCDNWSAPATFSTPLAYILHIDGYTSNSNGWNLIASPIGQVDPKDVLAWPYVDGNLAAPAQVTSMVSDNYDLYYYDQEQELEWITYREGGSATNPATAPGYDIQPGKGYLYANGQTVDLLFIGSAYNESGVFNLTYSTVNPDSYMHGWNLVGNPFPVEATIGEWDFMRMSADHNEIILYDPIEGLTVDPMEGIFVHADEDGQTITFQTNTRSSAKAKNSAETIVVNISKDQKLVDRAMVRFGEGRELPKYQLSENSTKVYFPVDGVAYSVVRSEGVGELPVSFKAEEDGVYTLSLNSNEVSFGYLHLIDNLTGNDVNLLETPSYSFEAKTTDYSHRFKLVFATGDDEDSFAYFSNGSFVINNDGKATVQVIDVTGRILKSESINGCANVNINEAAGVYVIRLINGDNVKVQKVVVK